MLIDFAPRVAARRQIRAEPRQVVARRAEVIEHRIDQHAEAAPVAGVDEPHQPVGPAVRFVHRVPEHAVVTPAVRAAERVDRHQLDEVDAEIDQVVQLLDRRVERAARRERADVQLVDDPALDRAACPVVVGPGVRRGLPQLRALVHTVGLAGGAGIGQHLRVVVEDEAVAGIAVGRRRRPATSRRRRGSSGTACRRRRGAPVRPRRPHGEFVVSHRRAPTARPATRRTGPAPAPVR